MRERFELRAVALLLPLVMTIGCSGETPTSPPAVLNARTSEAAVFQGDATAATGERIVGNAAIEPAYNADSGELMYLLTPIKAPLPSHANSHAVSPLYLVEYPPESMAADGGHFNCEGVPGNCPDHAGDVAQVAVANMPSVYGDDATMIPGHDHVADPPGKPDFNIAWEVVEVLFTDQGMTDGASDVRLTTDAQIDAAVQAGDAIEIDLGFAFNCNVVSETVYWRGAPVA